MQMANKYEAIQQLRARKFHHLACIREYHYHTPGKLRVGHRQLVNIWGASHQPADQFHIFYRLCSSAKHKFSDSAFQKRLSFRALDLSQFVNWQLKWKKSLF